MKYYINTFLIYSIAGYIIETVQKALFHPSMTNGSMYGPWIPLYGAGYCIIIFIMRLVFNRFKTNRIIKIITVFFLSMITLTLLEYISGNLTEFLTGDIPWNYDKKAFNFGHYICLEMSLLWGISSLAVIYIIQPIADKFIKKIPSIITYLVLFVFIVDVGFSLFK